MFSKLIFFVKFFHPMVYRCYIQSLEFDFNAVLSTTRNQLLIAVDRMEQSYESGYVLHHVSKTSMKLWLSQITRIPLSSLVSCKFFKFIFIAYHLYFLVRSQYRLHLCSSGPPTTSKYQSLIYWPHYQKAAYPWIQNLLRWLLSFRRWPAFRSRNRF